MNGSEKNLDKNPLEREAPPTNPEDPATWHRLGLDFVEQGEYVEAEEAFNKAVSLDPTYVDAWLSLAEVYEKLGDEIRAQEARSKAQPIITGNKKGAS